MMNSKHHRGSHTPIAQSIGISPAPNVSISAPPRLEKIKSAALRMCVSPVQVYREVKAGRLGPIIKLGPRASALDASQVDAWIAARMEEARQRAAKKGGA